MGATGRRLRACAAAAILTAAAIAAIGGGSAGAAAKPGVVVAWGSDADGQLGNGAAGGHLREAPVPGMTGVIDVHGGREHVIALKQNGTVWAGA